MPGQGHFKDFLHALEYVKFLKYLWFEYWKLENKIVRKCLKFWKSYKILWEDQKNKKSLKFIFLCKNVNTLIPLFFISR